MAIRHTMLACLGFLTAAVSAAGAEPARTAVRPADNGAALINPGMGWMFQHYDNNISRYTVDLEPWDGVDEFPGVSSVYIRLAWSYLEPEEGRFNWAIIDTPMQKWVSKGKTVAFRFTTSEGSPRQGFATPRWVEQAGARGFYIDARKIVEKSETWEPDFNDPVYLDKLDHFLAALAARYDGHSDVAFVDVGTFGVWGEGHTVASTGLPYDFATLKRHIDLHRKHFKRTLLVANDDFALQGRGLEILGYARDQGLGLRDDSILVEPGERAYYHAYLAHNFWPRVPVVLESEHYGSSKRRNAWGDGRLFLQAIEDYRASYATVHWFPREFLEDNADLVARINRRLGYRLQLVEASWPSEIPAGGSLAIGYSWRNAGVAPCLPGGHPTVTLKDAKDGIAAVFVDQDFNVRELPVGPPEKAKIISRAQWTTGFPQENKPLATHTIPPAHILKPGIYQVCISVGDATGRPVIALPLADDDGHRRYRLGTLTVTAAQQAPPAGNGER
jgi:hypothetical protein